VRLTLDSPTEGTEAAIRQGDVTSGAVVVEQLEPEDAD